MKQTAPVCENRCLSLHPQRRSTWLFSGSLRECFACNLSIVLGDSYIHSVRLAASHRIKVMLQNPKSIEVLSNNSSSSLHSIVSEVLEAVKVLSGNNPEIVLRFVQDIVAAAFGFDLQGIGDGRFRFCEAFMAASVSAVGRGSLMDTSTTVTMILLSSIVSTAVESDEIDTGQFYLSFKTAISGKEKTLLFVVADLLISGSSWHDFDVTNASVAIICALLSVYVPVEGDFVGEFAAKLAHGFQSAEGYHQQGNLMELTSVLLGTSAGKVNSSDSKLPVEMSFPTKEHIFANLNADNALTDILKICLLCDVQRTVESAIKVIEISCEGSPRMVVALVDGGITEYLFEGMRSHGTDCFGSLSCGNLQLYLKALDTMSTHSPHSLSSKWEYGFEIVLTAVSNCTNAKTEELGISVLYAAIDCMETTCISSAPLAKIILEFAGRIGGQASRSSMSMPTMSQSEPEFESKLRKTSLFLVEYSTVANFNVECISLLLEVVELYAGLLLDNELINKLAKVFLKQLSHLEESVEPSKCNDNIRSRVMNLVFCTLAEKAMKLAALAGSSDHDQEKLARETVDVLDILQLGLSSSFIFPAKGYILKSRVLSWCWHNVNPVSVLVLGDHLNEQKGDVSKANRSQVIKDYMYQLAQAEKYDVQKAQVPEIPSSSAELATALKLDGAAMPSSIAYFFLNMCMEHLLIQDEAFAALMLQSLSDKITETKFESSETVEKDFFETVCVFFRLFSSFPNLEVDLKIPADVWPRVVRSKFFSPDDEPDLFIYAIDKAENPVVKLIAWKKYAVRNRDRKDGGLALDERLRHLLQSSDRAVDGLYELVISVELSEEMLTSILSLLRAHSRKNYSAVPVLRRYEAVPALREAFRANSVANYKSNRSPRVGRKAHQLTGLLAVVSDYVSDWNGKELQQLTMMVCDAIRAAKIAPKETNAALLLGAARFLIRVFEDPSEESLSPPRAHVSKSPSVIAKFAKILALQSSHFMHEDDTQGQLLAASSACLLVLIFDHFTENSDQANASKLAEELPKRTVEWASLVTTLSERVHGDHAYTCRATNCCVLLSSMLEIANQSFRNSMEHCMLLRSALVSSSVSQNIILSNVALNTLVHIISKADLLNARFMTLKSEQDFADFLLSKLVRKNSQLLRAEAAFLGICAECNLIDVSSTRIMKRIEALSASEISTNNPHILNKDDVEKLKRAVQHQRDGQTVEPATTSNELAAPASARTSSHRGGAGDYNRRRKTIFGAHAVVLA